MFPFIFLLFSCSSKKHYHFPFIILRTIWLFCVCRVRRVNHQFLESYSSSAILNCVENGQMDLSYLHLVIKAAWLQSHFRNMVVEEGRIIRRKQGERKRIRTWILFSLLHQARNSKGRETCHNPGTSFWFTIPTLKVIITLIFCYQGIFFLCLFCSFTFCT